MLIGGWRAWPVASSAGSAGERAGDLVDRRLLSRADVHAILVVRGSDLLGDRQDEAPVVVDLLGRRLGLEQSDGLAQAPENMLLELVDRPGVRVVALGPAGGDLVE